MANRVLQRIDALLPWHSKAAPRATPPAASSVPITSPGTTPVVVDPSPGAGAPTTVVIAQPTADTNTQDTFNAGADASGIQAQGQVTGQTLKSHGIGPGGGGGFNLIAPADPQIANDPQRFAYEQQHPSVPWADVAATLTLDAGISVPFLAAPVGVAANGALMLELRAFLPVDSATDPKQYANNLASDLKMFLPPPKAAADLEALGKQLSTGLPLTSQKALAMPQGAEMLLAIGAKGSASVSAGENLQGDAGPIHGRLFAGAQLGADGGIGARLNVKRLDGDDFYLLDSHNRDLGVDEDLGAIANLSLDNETLINELRKSLFAEGVADVGDLVVSAPGASQATSDWRQSLDRLTEHGIVFHFSNPDACAAFDALVRGDRQPLATLIAKKSPAVTVLSYNDQTKAHDHTLDLQLGPVTFARVNHYNGTDTFNDTDGKDAAHGVRTLFQDSVNTLGGSRYIQWQGVQIQQNKADPQTFFHLTMKRVRNHTSSRVVDDFVRLGSALGAELDPGSEIRTPKAPSSNPFARVADRVLHRSDLYGKSNEKIDLYFTHEGLQNIHKTTDTQREAAYRQASEELGSQVSPRHLARFTQALAPMSNDNEQDWIQAFQKLGSSNRFDMGVAINALHHVAGHSETLIHELGIQSPVAILGSGAAKPPNLSVMAQSSGSLFEEKMGMSLDFARIGQVIDP